MLIEAAWSYRFPARISREQLLRQEGLPKPIRDTAWKAQERLCRRYRKLARAGKPATVVTTAIARELAGFVWAIAKQAQVAGADALRRAGHHPRRHRRHTSIQSWARLEARSRPGEPSSPLSAGIIRRWILDRGSSATHHRSGGNQPAHQSMINRRFMIVPPALPSGGHSETLARKQRIFAPAA